LNKFVVMLTSPEGYDSSFLDTFLLTYLSFTTADALFEKLKERFRVPDSAESKKGIFQLRVSVFLAHWIKKHFQSLLVSNITLLKNVWSFMDQEMIAEKGNASMTAMALGIKKTIGDAMDTKQEVVPVPPKPNLRIVSEISFVTMDEMTMAKHLTLQTSAIFQKLRPVELFNQKWTSERTKHLSPNVNQLIELFNHISCAVALCIVAEEKLRKRTKLMQTFMNIGRNLSVLRNYHLSMAFISGMSNAAVSRLKFTKEKISKSVRQTFDAAEQEMSLSGSYRNYRQAISTGDLPTIPYLGVHLQDLLFIEEGNPDTLDGLINWRKRDYIADVVKQFQRLQTRDYVFPELENHIEVSAFISQLPQLTDKETFDASLKREPRNASRSDIQ